MISFYSIDSCGLSSGGIQELTGSLLIKGIVREVTLVVNFSSVKREYRGARAHFNLYGSVNLKEWQLGISEDYGISDDVLITVELFLVRKKRDLDPLSGS